MFSIQNISSLEIRLHRSTKKALMETGLKSYEELISDKYMLTFHCEHNQKVRNVNLEHSYKICNEIMEYKGEEFKEELFSLYQTMFNYINAYRYKGHDEDYNKIKKQMQKIIDYIDLDFLYKYVNEIKPVKIPERLKEVFDDQTEIDGVGTRDQTYTRQDYRDLIPLLVMVKFIYPIIEEVMGTLDDSLKNLLTNQMLNLLKEFTIFNSKGLNKLMKYVKKIISSAPKEDIIIKVLSLHLSEDMIPEYYLVEMLFGKMVFLDLTDPNIEIVTNIFNDISTKLKNKGDVANRFRNNNKPRESEDSATDKGSVAENFRMATDITGGSRIELKYITKDLNRLMSQYNFEFDLEHINYAKEQVSKLENIDIAIVHINILSCLIRPAMDPRGILFLEFESIKNCMVVGYAILMKLGIPSLAYLLLSKKLIKIEDDVFDMNVSLESNKIKGYRNEELLKIYPIEKVISERNKQGGLNTEPLILDSVTNMAQEINSCKWQPPVGISVYDILVPDLKSKIVDMLIDIQKLFN